MLLQPLEERFLNMEKNTVQAEVTNFYLNKFTSTQSGAEFLDSVEAQAKILENLGRKITEDDTLTRLNEGLKPPNFPGQSETLRRWTPYIKRTNRNIKLMALSLMIDSGLPSVCWYKVIKHAVYFINMLPTKTSKSYI